MALNTKTAILKFGRIDHEINFTAKLLFLLMLCCALTLTLFRISNSEEKTNFTDFLKNIILLSSIIPISVRVNTDFAKIYYSVLINYDKELDSELTVARNTSVPEELGRI